MSLEAYTDYPITTNEWGDRGVDQPGVLAPIRKVSILAFDRNKYCTVRVEGIAGVGEIKFGYLYKEPGRCGEIPACVS